MSCLSIASTSFSSGQLTKLVSLAALSHPHLNLPSNTHHQVRRLLEQDRWREAIHLRKRKDHFIFTIESTGCVPAEDLMRNALTILVEKCDQLHGRL